MASNRRNIKCIIDFDGVLADSVSAMIAYYKDKYGDTEGYVPINNPSDLLAWDAHDVMPLLKPKEVEEIFESDVFWDNLNITKGAKEFINKYRDCIAICSIGTYENILRKTYFIKKHFGNVTFVPIVNDSPIMDKSIINMEGMVFIDDNMKNLQLSNAKHPICFSIDGLYDKQWNNQWHGLKADTFEQLDCMVESILNVYNVNCYKELS